MKYQHQNATNSNRATTAPLVSTYLRLTLHAFVLALTQALTASGLLTRVCKARVYATAERV